LAKGNLTQAPDLVEGLIGPEYMNQTKKTSLKGLIGPEYQLLTREEYH
jgi:hypothetical protein